MEPYYQDAHCTLYHGDVLDVLPVQPCHALITDPPFAFAGGISNGMMSNVSDQFFRHWWRDVATLFTQSVIPEGSGFVWCDWRTARTIEEGFQARNNAYGVWRLAQMLYHYREMPGQGQPFRSSVDMLAYVRGPRHKTPPIPNTTHNFISQYWYYGKHDYHPAEKSLDIAKRLIAWCSQPGEAILDGFCGSGTTLVAAKALGRQAIGVDMEEWCCEVSAKRLQQEVLPLRYA